MKLDRIKLSATVLPSAFGDHLAIVAAIRDRDAHAATDAMDGHIMNARERALALGGWRRSGRTTCAASPSPPHAG